MKFVAPLNEVEITTLEELFRNHKDFRTRMRGHGVLLSSKGFTIAEISKFYDVNRDSTSRWLSNWESEGIAGLFDDKKSGRPPKLNEAEQKRVVDYVKEEPRSIKQAVAKIEKEHNKIISVKTVRRILKKGRMIWKRVRTSLKSKRDPEKFAAAREEIRALTVRQERKEIDLYYSDEVGFNLTPKTFYAWQEIGGNIELPSARSKSFNVLAVFQKNGQFDSIVFDESIDTEMVISYFDQWADTLKKETWIIIDNSPIHTSSKFKKMIPVWKEKQLNFYFLPPYSPELNLIEIVWRFMKYKWLPLSAYLNLQTLEKSLTELLSSIGISYNITFV
jgi:transposase